MFTMTRKLGTISLLALGAVAAGCGDEGSADEVVASALTGQQKVAFQNTDNLLWVDDGGTAFNTGLGMSAGTLPSQAWRPDGGLELAFQDQNHHLFVALYGISADDTGQTVSSGTSPSLGVFSDNANGFAFRGTNGHLFAAGHATGVMEFPTFPMGTGASPSAAVTNGGGLAVAYRGSNGHLFYSPDIVANAIVDTHAVMASGTNPSVAQHSNGEFVVAFQGVNGHLWVIPNAGTTGANGFDSGFAMKAGTSPAVSSQSAFPVGISDIAFQGSNGDLQNVKITKQPGNHSSMFEGPFEPTPHIPMAAGRSPTIQTTGSGFQAAAKGSNGHLWINLNGTAQDQGFSMN